MISLRHLPSAVARRVASGCECGDGSVATGGSQPVAIYGCRRWLEFAGDIGLPVTAAEAVIDKLLDHLGGIDDALASGALPFAPSVTRALVKELRYRRRQMVDTAA